MGKERGSKYEGCTDNRAGSLPMRARNKEYACHERKLKARGKQPQDN